MKRKFVIINSTARAGKDTLATHLSRVLESKDCATFSFKDPLIDVTCAFLGCSRTEFLDGYDLSCDDYIQQLNDKGMLKTVDPMVAFLLLGEKYTWVKDVPFHNINGLWYSKRECLIKISEKVIKPVAGARFFGEAVLKTINSNINISTDGGFVDECLPLIESVESPEDVLILRINGNRGADIVDSRKLLVADDFPDEFTPTFMDVTNNLDTDLNEFLVDATNKVLTFLKENENE